MAVFCWDDDNLSRVKTAHHRPGLRCCLSQVRGFTSFWNRCVCVSVCHHTFMFRMHVTFLNNYFTVHSISCSPWCHFVALQNPVPLVLVWYTSDAWVARSALAMTVLGNIITVHSRKTLFLNVWQVAFSTSTSFFFFSAGQNRTTYDDADEHHPPS